MSKHDIETASVEATPPQRALGHTNGATKYVPRPSTIGNPGTLITHPNVVVGMAIFCGGLAQLLAGMWEFPRGNVFGGTAFTSYGAFWMAYATILIPSSGILAAYQNKSELQSALGIFLTAWTMVTWFFFVGALGKNIAFIALFGFLGITFAALAAGEFYASAGSTKAGGVLGVVTAFIAYYIGLSELLATEAHPVVRLPLGLLHTNRKQD
ncbi:hypothetical protein DXG03_000936 [Asterophora parasitica]|uniref:Gpr1 family protein n=1 Tax=Asterophora parasitica TaxID=117018 RepID=A0A9P7G797_9AGAR|nr:hypothetical protein DXG03_000936 [Asterophora parasitica]